MAFVHQRYGDKIKVVFVVCIVLYGFVIFYHIFLHPFEWPMHSSDFKLVMNGDGVDSGHDAASFLLPHIDASSTMIPTHHVDCPRFLFAHGNPDGVGHRFSSIVLASKIAQDINATLVLDDKYWKGGSRYHGTFPLFRRLFGFHHFLSFEEIKALNIPGDLEEVSPATLDELYEVFNGTAPTALCDIVVHTFTGSRYCDGGRAYCFRNKPGLFNDMKGLFRDLSDQNEPVLGMVPSYARYTDSLVVFWHIRSSDISLHIGEDYFFRNVAKRFSQAASTLDVTFMHYFLVGDQNFPTSKRAHPPSGYAFLSTIFPNAKFISSSLAEVDLHQFRKADILVGSGSSFAHAAAVITPAPGLIYLYPPPKESSSLCDLPWQTYYVNDSIILNDGGKMSEESYKKFKGQLRVKLGISFGGLEEDLFGTPAMPSGSRITPEGAVPPLLQEAETNCGGFLLHPPSGDDYID